MPAHKYCVLFLQSGSASHLGRQRSDSFLGAHHPLGPVIKLDLRHPRKRERKKIRTSVKCRIQDGELKCAVP